MNYNAVNLRDGTWILEAGVITPDLSEGVYDVAVTATDFAGNIGVDTTTNDLTIIDSAQVVGRYIFYNDSYFDWEVISESHTNDDNAIAADKAALLPGQTATFANYTSYSHGINGIMVDIKHPG